jgi:hypothetical protein
LGVAEEAMLWSEDGSEFEITASIPLQHHVKDVPDISRYRRLVADQPNSLASQPCTVFL